MAVFEPVQIEGTTVSRASLCNLTEIERLGVGKECTLSVIKANKIIPKCIAVKDAVGAVEIPKECPVCHHPTRIFVSKNSGVRTLHCTNPDCTAKNVKKFSRFVSKSGMDIDGLSVQTMLKFINEGFIKQFPDIYHLPEHFDKISSMEGFGEKSCTNMQAAIEKSRHVHPVNLIFALCIPLIGTDAGKKIVNTIGFDGFADRMRNATDFVDIDGIGQEKSGSILEWYANPKNSAMFEALIKELDIEKVDIKDMSEGSLNGKTFVITGDVHDFANRSEFKAYVESQGGKVYVEGLANGMTDVIITDAAGRYAKLPVSIYTTDVMQLDVTTMEFKHLVGETRTKTGKVVLGNGGYTIASDNDNVQASIDFDSGEFSITAKALSEKYTATVTVGDCTGISEHWKWVLRA